MKEEKKWQVCCWNMSSAGNVLMEKARSLFDQFLISELKRVGI